MDKECFINVGLFRTGSTTLATAAESLGMKTFTSFPELEPQQLRRILFEPEKAVLDWWRNGGGKDQILENIKFFDFLGDGWMPLLVFLPPSELDWLKRAASRKVKRLLIFVATTRDREAAVRSELHHWVRHSLEAVADLNVSQRQGLEAALHARHESYSSALEEHCVKQLPLSEKGTSAWPELLGGLSWSYSSEAWRKAFKHAGRQNQNPSLPLEAILLTLPVEDGEEAVRSVDRLLDDVEKDSLSRYMVVLAIDANEFHSEAADYLRQAISKRDRVESLCVIENARRELGKPFKICHVWDNMAKAAWEAGATWVALLGDDVRIHCDFHYRAIYRAFLNIQQSSNCPLGFGCPWFNDTTFPGFPTFPVVGRVHYDIFGALIPSHRADLFVNQDLDPYLQRLYLKFGAAPPLHSVLLSNGRGGNDIVPARYDRLPADGWRDWVLQDVAPIRQYAEQHEWTLKECILLDVVVPTYRIELEYLKRLTSQHVPPALRTTFIVIVDNPILLRKMAKTEFSKKEDVNVSAAAAALEAYLTAKSPANNIRVRCNETNQGVAASRNRGMDESSAEYLLFLDDDVIPNHTLLEAYAKSIVEHHQDNEFAGVLGLVQFPRTKTLPMIHAAVLMSYLTFMFEIAEDPPYTHPAWGVTANLLVRRSSVRFNILCPKMGGGEDVDFCLRLQGKLCSNAEALVEHKFWKGSALHLASHFANWAVGDSALFHRFPEHRYRSWPNAPETILVTTVVVVVFHAVISSPTTLMHLLGIILLIIVSDFMVDVSYLNEFRHRRRLLKVDRSLLFVLAAHFLANLYVIILESGRLYGHFKRGNLSNLVCRFDWHCGQLVNAREKFARKELIKFVCFLASIAVCEWFS